MVEPVVEVAPVAEIEAPAIAGTSETSEETTLVVDAEASVAPAAADIERPKSPWTPSYSVTSQGPGIAAEDSKEVEKLEQLPPPAEQPEVVLSAEPEAAPTVEANERVRSLKNKD